MRLDTLFETKAKIKKPVIAFEVFPPKKNAAVESVYGSLAKLAELPVDYISVTYSAGGTGNTAYTGEMARHLKHDLLVEPLPHLTCYSSNREDIASELAAFTEIGAENVMALRGDANPDVLRSVDYTYASDLVRDIRSQSDIYIVGGCYPEKHQESKSLEDDIEALKTKVDAGVGHLVTQLFFDNGKYYAFLDKVRQKGIDCLIEAGTMPIVRPDQVDRILPLSGASIPGEFQRLIERYADDAESFYSAGLDYSVRQIRELIEQGAPGVHLYVMNRADVAAEICEGIADLL
ncbi:MAG: methylenetetrahydrofolate reductase [Clostridiales Family XIII bacterium]|jgi:methylenetetrahydrofolate reductase (NADPH)|nr:methylenetetrahydrofolate reductase [Clostridiales Family XIII bacterium]